MKQFATYFTHGVRNGSQLARASITRTAPRRSWEWWMRFSSANWRACRFRFANEVDEQSLPTLLAERDTLKRRCEQLEAFLSNVGYPPGHFYSPIVDVSDRHAIKAVTTRVDAPLPAGIQIDAPAMTSMMERLAEHHRHFPFPRHQAAGYRFCFDNPFFGCYDASVLFSMLLECQVAPGH